MLSKALRRQIEWHFKNYEADQKLYTGRERDITSSGLTPSYSRVGNEKIGFEPSIRGSGVSKPTEDKAVRLWELDCDKNWAGVVRNTFLAFRFEPEFELMKRLYIEHEGWRSVIASGVNESTFWYWRDRWLKMALMWAKEYRLL